MFNMGAHILDKKTGRIQFRVFAFDRKEVFLVARSQTGKEKVFTMNKESPHIFSVEIEGMGTNILYKYRLDRDGHFPDPYSNYQPEGVHGFSAVVDHESYCWGDTGWKGMKLEEQVIYEIHIGTFTREGTFRAAADKLDYIAAFGANTVELMPVVQTPGRWNWGYDGCNLFSVNANYGTPDDLKFFIDSCHQKGISVLLDTVYNHFGPEGSYLGIFGPYFTSRHKTPWGEAVNYDDSFCEFARSMVLENVRYWLKKFHFDGLRLDAVQTIMDESATHILEEIAREAKAISCQEGRYIAVIAETDENDVKLINPPEKGGYGLDAQWMDDFHHCVHTALTGENEGYYIDYGRIRDFEKVYRNFLYTGEYSLYWQKNRGTDASQNPGRQFVVCIQNHDQVGNRALGERLSALVDFPFLKLAAGLLFLSPYIPLLFMGEEYGEEKPFLFFTDYGDPELKKAVSRGRKEEFSSFGWQEIADPEDDDTFYFSRLTLEKEWQDHNKQLLAFYRDLIMLRKTHPILQSLNKKNIQVSSDEKERTVIIERWNGKEQKLKGIFNLGSEPIFIKKCLEKELYNMLLHSGWARYGGNVQEGSANENLAGGDMVLLERY